MLQLLLEFRRIPLNTGFTSTIAGGTKYAFMVVTLTGDKPGGKSPGYDSNQQLGKETDSGEKLMNFPD